MKQQDLFKPKIRYRFLVRRGKQLCAIMEREARKSALSTNLRYVITIGIIR